MKLNKYAIEILRAEKGFTVSDLSKKSRVSQPTINRGFKKDITPVSAGKLAKALDMPVQDIIISEETT